MRILWFSNTPANAESFFNINRKGTGGWMQALDKALQDKIELHVAFYHSYPESFKYLNTTYHPIKRFKNKYSKWVHLFFNKVLDRQNVDQYIKIIEKVNPDIIHIHGTESSFGVVTELTQVPIVLSIQGNITVYRHKYYSGIPKKFGKNTLMQNLQCRYVKSFNDNFRQFIKQEENEQKYFPNFKHIIGRTDWDKRISRLLAPMSKYYHVDEILRDTFYVNKWEMTENKKLIVHSTTGNTYYKGFETIARAVSLLNNAKIDVMWQLAGLSEDDTIVLSVKKYLGKYYPISGLKFLGKLDERGLKDELLKADVFVMASHIENSPNNLCEAMILGMPCVASFAGGTGSLITDREDGFLIQDGDPWVLAGILIDYIKNSSSFVKCGEIARERALLRHDEGRIVQKLINVYDEIINSK